MEPLLVFNNEWTAQTFTLDLSFGDSENDFELTLPTKDLKIRPALGYSFGMFAMAIDGTEYGGFTDQIEVSTDDGMAKVTGRTWHGVLAHKIIQPPSGADYYTASGDLNAVISKVLDDIKLTDFYFHGVDYACGVSVTNYRFDRYTDAWAGLRKLCRDNGARLSMQFRDSMLYVEAKVLGETPMLDSDETSFTMTRVFPCTNHIIGLGSGELKDREVVHAWADEYGNVTTTTDSSFRLWLGYMEVAETYEATSSDELADDTAKQLEDAQDLGSISMEVGESRDIYGIDEILSARNNDFGAVEVTARVSQKVVKIDKGSVTVSYKVADAVVKEVES